MFNDSSNQVITEQANGNKALPIVSYFLAFVAMVIIPMLI